MKESPLSKRFICAMEGERSLERLSILDGESHPRSRVFGDACGGGSTWVRVGTGASKWASSVEEGRAAGVKNERISVWELCVCMCMLAARLVLCVFINLAAYTSIQRCVVLW